MDNRDVSTDEVRLLSQVTSLLLDCWTSLSMCELSRFESKTAFAFLADHYLELGRLSLHPMPLTALSLAHKDLTVFRAWVFTKLTTAAMPIFDVSVQPTTHMDIIYSQPTTFYGEDTDPQHKRIKGVKRSKKSEQ